ncbi:unnamed protein product [Lepeophtheirus salmonis]|nr:unnamed protein product [Lepeophtheirus salmonis]CAF2883157.1 unnamed protein product [Lepeophtheirus salmonis]
MKPRYGSHRQAVYSWEATELSLCVWALCSTSGHNVFVEPYCGRRTDIEKSMGGQCPDVVMALVNKTKASPGSQVLCYNLFTSIPLLKQLRSKGINGTGTMRQNRLGYILLTSKKMVVKEFEIGNMDSKLYLYMAVFVWKDNKVKYLARKSFKCIPSFNARRHARS